MRGWGGRGGAFFQASRVLRGRWWGRGAAKCCRTGGWGGPSVLVLVLCLGILDSPAPRLRVCLLGNGRGIERISRGIDPRHRLLIADAHPLCLQHRMILTQQERQAVSFVPSTWPRSSGTHLKVGLILRKVGHIVAWGKRLHLGLHELVDALLHLGVIILRVHVRKGVDQRGGSRKRHHGFSRSHDARESPASIGPGITQPTINGTRFSPHNIARCLGVWVYTGGHR